MVGNYSSYDIFENAHSFDKYVKYHFDFVGDKLIIGKYKTLQAMTMELMVRIRSPFNLIENNILDMPKNIKAR